MDSYEINKNTCAIVTINDSVTKIVEDKDDYYEDAIQYITDKLETEREWLDENIYDRDFCVLLDKYYDTHEQS